MIDFTFVNFVAVIIATAATMILGSLWYSPLLFGKKWMNLVGLTEDDAKKGMGSAMAMGLAVAFLVNIVLALLLPLLGPAMLDQSLVLGFLLWLGVALPVDLDKVIWAKAPVQLLYINAGYKLVSFLVSVTILTLLGW